MWAVGLVAGALLGATIDHQGWMVLGAIVGFILGLVAARRRQDLLQRVTALETRINVLNQALATPPAPQGSAGETVAEASSNAPPPSEDQEGRIAPTSTVAPPPSPVTTAETSAQAGVLPVRKGGKPILPQAASEEAQAPAAAAASSSHRWLEWIISGNTFARVGIVLLFIGIGFLLKYAAEHVQVPLEWRLSGVAVGGIALLVVGWRLRARREAYAMILQGGGVGVLYLTVFAAFRLYGMLAPGEAFGFLICMAGLSSFLAVRQDAVALAATGVIGGFLAPILTSSETGNHVILFGYYALLNAGIFGIAWFKSWRSLNLLGFVFTFLIGTLWGVTRYRPEDFATTEPFLVLFFVFYVGIAVLYALRQSIALRSYVDATLVFGTPLLAAGLQSALVRDRPYGMAISALAASALYLCLARAIYAGRGETLRMLVEAFLALGVIFATLAVPLALDARWTSATWALEGAALAWVGLRQHRRAARVCGVLLQLGAGIAFALSSSYWHAPSPRFVFPVLNSECIGAILVGVAGLYTAWQLYRHRDDLDVFEGDFTGVVFAWGVLWWLEAGWREVERWSPPENRVAALVLFLCGTAIAFAFATRRLEWKHARVPALLLFPVLLIIALISIGGVWRIDGHLFAHGGAIAWPLAIAVIIGLLRYFDATADRVTWATPLVVDAAHATAVWLATLVVAQELGWVGSHVGSGNGIWRIAPWGAVPGLVLMAITTAAASPRWPMVPHRHGYLIIAAIPLAVWLVLWSLVANLAGDADPMPLPYLPLLNPVDITEAVVLAAGAMWLLYVRRRGNALVGPLSARLAVVVLVALLFVWLNAFALRSIHFWFDIAYTFDALWRSRLVQAVLSLLWTLIALGTVVLANRRYWRGVWITGAALLAIVVAKLFFVDLSQVGGVERIISFIGVGLLLLLVGYVAPVPPRRAENLS